MDGLSKDGIRLVEDGDVERLVAIYAPYVDTPVTFEYELPSVKEFGQRVKEISARYPYLVYEAGEKIVGYAYAHELKERIAYQWAVELSVYVDKSCMGKGYGSKLYKTLIETLSLQKIQNLYACITYPNERSEILHRNLGFELVGRYNKSGYKCNSWYDVLWYERFIGDHHVPPEPFVPIGLIPRENLYAVLRRGGDFSVEG